MIPTLILRFSGFFLLYLVLAGSLDRQEIVAALAVSLLLTLVSRRVPRLNRKVRWSGKVFVSALVYPMVFLKALLLSNLDVARRVLTPSLPIHPGIVRVKTQLKSPLGRLVLANAITLTPGTLTVESHDEWLYIHWVDVKDGTVDAATEAIVRQFERHLEVLFG